MQKEQVLLVWFAVMLGAIVGFGAMSAVGSMRSSHELARQTDFFIRSECAWERDQITPPNPNTTFVPVAECK